MVAVRWEMSRKPVGLHTLYSLIWFGSYFILWLKEYTERYNPFSPNRQNASPQPPYNFTSSSLALFYAAPNRHSLRPTAHHHTCLLKLPQKYKRCWPRAWIGLFMMLIGCIPLLVANFVNGRDRWPRLLAIPGMWLGLTFALTSLHGVRLFIQSFGKESQIMFM